MGARHRVVPSRPCVASTRIEGVARKRSLKPALAKAMCNSGEPTASDCNHESNNATGRDRAHLRTSMRVREAAFSCDSEGCAACKEFRPLGRGTGKHFEGANARKKRSQEATAQARLPSGTGIAEMHEKAGVVQLVHCRGFCIPLWAVFPPLQVVLSSACSVASLSRFPSHYLPGHPHLREGALAAYLFGWGSPSTWRTGRSVVHDSSSATLPHGAQRGVTLPR